MAMARVRVVRRWDNVETIPVMPRKTAPLRPAVELIAIGASAGGPSALSNLLKELPADYKLPIVIAQHMPAEFTNGLARWLEKASALQVMVATNNLTLEPGVVYLAPGGTHLAVTRCAGQLCARIIPEQGDHRYQPSVNVLFNAVAETCGAAGIGVILTGMGDDGADGLLAMRKAGAATYAQDEASCTVFGMPGAAINQGAVENVLALSNLATTLAGLKLR
jgi:two-component system chemotaxis response regulator CheB